MNLEDKVVVITGGVSGLGKATAEYMASVKGARVGLIDINEEAGVKTVEEIGENRAIFCRADVTKPDEIDCALSKIVSRFGAIHADINAAAIPLSFKIVDKEGKANTGIEKFANVVNVNLCGVYNVMAKCIEYMALNEPNDGERGAIINVSSPAAFEGTIGQVAYSASKAGINGINLQAARELGPLGIRVNSIAPGLFATPMAMSLDDKIIKSYIRMIESPKRFGRVNEFAHACSFILENGYMNGRVIRLDAATVAQTK